MLYLKSSLSGKLIYIYIYIYIYNQSNCFRPNIFDILVWYLHQVDLSIMSKLHHTIMAIKGFNYQSLNCVATELLHWFLSSQLLKFRKKSIFLKILKWTQKSKKIVTLIFMDVALVQYVEKRLIKQYLKPP